MTPSTDFAIEPTAAAIPKESFSRHYERIKDALPSSVRSKPNS